MKIPHPMIRWCMLCSVCANTAYSVCSPLLPIEFAHHGIVSSLVGMTFSFYSLGNIVMPPFIGKYIDRIGHQNLISGALGTMGVSFICFGFIEDMENKLNIVILSMVLRLIHGITCTTNATTCYSTLMNEFPAE